MIPTHQKMLAELTSTIGIALCDLQKKTIVFSDKMKHRRGRKHTSAVCPWMLLAC